MGGTRFIGVFLSRLLVKEGHQVLPFSCLLLCLLQIPYHLNWIVRKIYRTRYFGQVTLFTRGKAPVTQQLPGESDADYAEFSSKVL